ncbi:hypothetical protein M2271_003566 [Streptomyces sp. LBL]|uniref:hypothetical protein n=1 Tax=Streptomyces sp. LBL TaxID=2940562 RepID=UPI002475B371|nr:hypothetical protein [Streptomyces sp. LBL]MDH6625755.1 hypothetical protein [Streptomyces sp. LBL]
MEPLKDARGVEIHEGATCVYGAGVGRSIALVEAVVDGFTSSGRVWVKVVRRAYGGGWADGKKRVHVGADRLVVVDVLPDSDLPTDAERQAEQRRANARLCRERIVAVEAGGTYSGFGTPEEALTFYRKWLADLERRA